MGNITEEAWIVRSGVSYATIALALAAASNGDTILLSEGQFIEDVDIALDNIGIMGQGEDHSIIQGRIDVNLKPGFRLGRLTSKSGTNGGIKDLGDNAHFKDVFVEEDTTCNDPGIECGNNRYSLYLENVHVKGFDIGILLSGVKSARLKNVYVNNADVTGIDIHAISVDSYIDMDGCYISECDRNGILLEGSCRGKVRNTTITRCGTDGSVYAGVNALSSFSGYFEFINCNIVYNNYGVYLTTGVTEADLRFVNCAIYGNAVKDAASTDSFEMEYNWWGTGSPSAGQFTNIDYTPFLTQPIGISYNSEIINAVKAKTDNLPSDPADQSLIIAATDAIVVEINANETKIDTAITEIAKITPEVSIHIDHPEEIKIPDASNTLNGALAAGATSVIFDDASAFPDKSYFKCESEWIYYGAKSANTLSSLTRAQFGTGDATHADGTAVYQGIPHKTILSIHDAGVPKTPNSTPQITIKTIGGTTIQSATNMTQEGAKVGIYYFDILFTSSQDYPDVWVLMYDVEALSGKTNEYRKMSLIVGESATQSDIQSSGNTPLAGLRQATQAGYYDASGTFTAWTDDEVGVWTDAQGDFVFRGLIVWQHIVSGSVKRQVNPPASTWSEADGEWVVFIAPGTYMVHFWKDGLKDVEVERTVT